MKLLSLINEKPSISAHANMGGSVNNFSILFNTNFDTFFNSYLFNKSKHVNKGWIIDSGANQHMTYSDKRLTNIVDVFDLKLTVGHPNGTQARIH